MTTIILVSLFISFVVATVYVSEIPHIQPTKLGIVVSIPAVVIVLVLIVPFIAFGKLYRLLFF